MPIYAYQCQGCGEQFELLVRASSTPVCPSCGSQQLDKQVTLTSPPGKSKAIIAANRALAAREGHLSNFSPAERKLR